MSMIYIGIDNGVTTGGMVAIGQCGSIIAMSPMLKRKWRSRNELDIGATKEWFHMVCDGWPENATFVIEEPNNSRNASTAYSVASCFHALRGLIESKSLAKFRRITPQSWQKAMLRKFAAGDSKIAALEKARESWPDESWLASKRCSTPHPGMIDAALIAEYGRTKNL